MLPKLSSRHPRFLAQSNQRPQAFLHLLGQRGATAAASSLPSLHIRPSLFRMAPAVTFSSQPRRPQQPPKPSRQPTLSSKYAQKSRSQQKRQESRYGRSQNRSRASQATALAAKRAKTAEQRKPAASSEDVKGKPKSSNIVFYGLTSVVLGFSLMFLYFRATPVQDEYDRMQSRQAMMSRSIPQLKMVKERHGEIRSKHLPKPGTDPT